MIHLWEGVLASIDDPFMGGRVLAGFAVWLTFSKVFDQNWTLMAPQKLISTSGVLTRRGGAARNRAGAPGDLYFKTA